MPLEGAGSGTRTDTHLTSLASTWDVVEKIFIYANIVLETNNLQHLNPKSKDKQTVHNVSIYSVDLILLLYVLECEPQSSYNV